MRNISRQDETAISKQFAAFCCRVLKNETCNIHIEYGRQNKKEKSLTTLSTKEVLNLSMCDCYFKKVFNICGMQIVITDYDLAEAIYRLLPLERKVIILSYFADMTDKQTASMLGLTAWDVFKCRTRSLKQLKKYLAEEN